MKKFFLPLCALFAIVLFCQEKRGITHMGVDEGLSQGSVFDMAQDDQGFLWIGTADGLNRYDGYNIKVYRDTSTDSISRYPVHIRGVFKGKDAMYITTSSTMQLYRLDLITQKMRLVYDNTSPGLIKELLVLKEDADTIWLLSSDKGVIILNWRTGATIEEFPSARDAYPSPNVVAFDSLKSIVWYLGYFGENLNSFDLKTKEFRERSFLNSVSGKKYQITSITRGNEDEVWVGGCNSILRYIPAKDTFEQYAIPYNAENVDRVTTLFEVNPQELWCGTERGYIYVFDETEKTFSIRYNANPKDGNTPHRTVKFLKDRSNNLWVGTDPDGLYKIDLKQKPFHHTKHDAIADSSLRNNFIKCFLERGNETFVGLYNNCISVMDHSTGKHRYINGFDNSATNLPTVSSMVCDSSGRIWASTSQGLGILEPGSNYLTRPNVSPYDSRIYVPTNTLYFINDHTLLAGIDTGMYRLNIGPSLCSVTFFPLRNIVEKFMVDHAGRLWVAASGGIYFSADGTAEDLHLIISKFGRAKSILQLPDHTIWVGTENGLCCIDPVTLQVSKSYSEGSGMPNSFVYGILSDNHENLWLSTNKGLSRFNPATETFRNYSVSDGLQSNEFNTGAYYKSPSGEMYFGGVNGFNYFFPDEIGDNPFPSRCVITGFSVFDQPLVSDTTIEYCKQISLDYSQNNIRIEYSGLEFSDPAKNRYKYRLIGLDTNWIDVGKERFARFVNLDPGAYTFQVKASNNDGIWNETPLELHVTITPPFWKTVPFIIMSTVITLLLIIFGIRFYFRRQLKVKTRELELKQSVRMTAVFETEENERKRIAGELHDGLGQLLSTARLNVSGIGENLDPKYSVLYRNSVQLLDQACEEVRNISHNMMPGALIRMGLITAVNELIIKINDAEKIRVEFETQIEERFPETIEITIYRVIQEALNNMVKHSEAKNIRVQIIQNGDALEVTIKDDGKGFDVARIAESKGLGWKNMYSRVESLNGTLRVESEKGKGTTLYFTIPL